MTRQGKYPEEPHERKSAMVFEHHRKALFHLPAAETSCYRYWGEGVWTDYGAELSRRVTEIVTNDF